MNKITSDFINSPLFRTSVGFDRMFNHLERQLTNQSGNYPPYNIRQVSDDHYEVTMAVAGFSESEIKLEQEKDILRVEGSIQHTESDSEYLHRGLAMRDFRREFVLSEHVKVTGAKLELGLLKISLEREIPADEKPKRIDITS
jgi:molecular chaperone IbpA